MEKEQSFEAYRVKGRESENILLFSAEYNTL